MVALKPRTATVTLYQGDDLAKLADLANAVDEARNDKTPATVGEGVPIGFAVDAYNDFLAEASERAVVVHLQHVGRLAFRELLAAHPVRGSADDYPADDAWGANDLTFPPALVLACWRDASRTEHERVDFLDSLCEADFDRLVAAAYSLCKAPLAPKALSLSAMIQKSDEM